MIFKTWLSDLSMVTKATEGINMSIMAVGAADYSKAIDGLSLSQAKLLLNMQGIDAEQQKSLLLQAGLISSSEKMTASHVAQALSNTTLKNTEQERVLIKTGLMNVQSKELLLENSCTEAKLRETLATTTLDATEKNAIVTRILGSNTNGGYAISFDVLTASIWTNIKAMAKWLVTNPVGWCALVAAAIFGVVKAFDALTVSFDEAVEKTKSSKQELKQLTSELSNLNNELKTTEDRIEELLEKANSGTISLLEEEELEKLREQNDELQREIDLKEKLADIDAKEAAENAAFSLTYKTDNDKWDDEYHATDRIDKLQNYIDTANLYKDKISEINQQILDIEESATDSSYKNDPIYKNLIKQQQKYQDELQKTEQKMSSTYKELTDEDDGLYYNGKVIEGYEDLDERLNTVYTSVELYLDDGNVDNIIEEYKKTIKNKLLETGLSEEISNAVSEGFSEEELDSIMNSDSIDWSACLDLDDATAVIENIKEQLASVENLDENPISLPYIEH